jgi:hypothetical protein
MPDFSLYDAIAMNDTQRKFAARRDLAGLGMIVGIFALGMFLLVRHDLIPWPMVDKIGWLFIVLGVIALWDWSITFYEIVQEQLIIRGGLSSHAVPLCNIEEVRPRHGKLRLRCHKLRGSAWITVMPVDLAAFQQRLWQKCPWLRQEGA